VFRKVLGGLGEGLLIKHQMPRRERAAPEKETLASLKIKDQDRAMTDICHLVRDAKRNIRGGTVDTASLDRKLDAIMDILSQGQGVSVKQRPAGASSRRGRSKEEGGGASSRRRSRSAARK
jgi:hypothetical protein